jgi:hypothetical protein
MTPRLDRPIILFCSERSGSNLITRMFDAHPAIAAPGSADLLRVFAPLAGRYAGRARALRTDMLALFAAKIPVWRLDALHPEEWTGQLDGCETAQEIAAAIYAAEVALAGKAHAFIKENEAHLFIDDYIALGRHPRFLWMVRDPRDMALSWTKAQMIRGGVLRAAARWQADQEGALALSARLQPVFLRYEDLIGAPEASLRRVCAELEIDFSARMLEPARYAAHAVVDAGRTGGFANLGRPIINDNAGKFREGLEPLACAYVETLCAPLMERFGYERTRPPCDLAAAQASLAEVEPWEKPGYAALPAAERARLEGRSALVANLRAA